VNRVCENVGWRFKVDRFVQRRDSIGYGDIDALSDKLASQISVSHFREYNVHASILCLFSISFYKPSLELLDLEFNHEAVLLWSGGMPQIGTCMPGFIVFELPFT
jgi:hypothetical protein